jgi:hypothetical protein
VLFNAILHMQYFLAVWNTLSSSRSWNLGKTLILSTHNLLGMIGKPFEKILLSRFHHDMSKHRLLRDEQFGFRPKQSIALQLTRLVETCSRNLNEKRLTGAGFPDLARPLSRLTASYTSSSSLTFPHTWLKPFCHTWKVGRSKRPSYQPHLLAVARGLVWHWVAISRLSSLACM